MICTRGLMGLISSQKPNNQESDDRESRCMCILEKSMSGQKSNNQENSYCKILARVIANSSNDADEVVFIFLSFS